MPSSLHRLHVWNNWIRVIVTIGLVTGYFVAVKDQEKKRSSLLSISILLPANLLWLWLIRSGSDTDT